MLKSYVPVNQPKEGALVLRHRVECRLLAPARVDQLQRVGLEDALDLIAGVDGPGTGCV